MSIVEQSTQRGTMTEREKFEASLPPRADLGKGARSGRYKNPVVQAQWGSWQESRRAAIEECCAAIKTEDDRASDKDYMLDSDDCIRVLRALLEGS